MICRHGRVLPVLVLGLLAPVGCLRWQHWMPQTPVAEQQPAPPSGAASGLTPAQAAQLCLTAGQALEKKGFTAEALEQYENARRQDPQAAGVARRLAVVYDLQGDTSRAETEYLRAMQEQPGNAELLNDFGYFHYRHDHLAEAENWLRKAVVTDPNCVCAWTNLGQVLASQGRAEESYQAFTQVLRPAEAYSNVGILLAKYGHTAEGRKALQEAIKLDPRLSQARAFLNALEDMPAPLPPGLTHTPPPVLPMSASEPAPFTPPPPASLAEPVKKAMPSWQAGSISCSPAPNPPGSPSLATPSKPAPPAVRQAPQMEWSPPSRGSTPPPLAAPPSVSSRPPTPPPDLPDLPVIVNGPLQPAPIATRSVSLQMAEASSCAKASRTLARKTLSLPPSAPPPLPPLALPAVNSSEEPTLIRTSVSTGKPEKAHARAAAPPKSLPPLPRSAPLAHKSLTPSVQPPSRPRATLTDCGSEHQPEHDLP